MCNQQGQSTADDGEQGTLGQQLANNVALRCAQADTHGDFTLT